jgi:predicted dehydrogenase
VNDLRLRIYGDKGGLEVGWERNTSSLRACLEPDLQTAKWHKIACPVLPTIYERFIAAIRGTGAAEPDFARGAALQRLLDRAEQSAAQKGVSLAV